LIFSLSLSSSQIESDFIDHQNDHYILGESNYKNSIVLTNPNLMLSELVQLFKASFNLGKNIVVYKDEEAFEKYKSNFQAKSMEHIFFEKRYKGLFQVQNDGPISFDYFKKLNKNN